MMFRTLIHQFNNALALQSLSLVQHRLLSSTTSIAAANANLVHLVNRKNEKDGKKLIRNNLSLSMEEETITDADCKFLLSKAKTRALSDEMLHNLAFKELQQNQRNNVSAQHQSSCCCYVLVDGTQWDAVVQQQKQQQKMSSDVEQRGALTLERLRTVFHVGVTAKPFSTLRAHLYENARANEEASKTFPYRPPSIDVNALRMVLVETFSLKKDPSGVDEKMAKPHSMNKMEAYIEAKCSEYVLINSYSHLFSEHAYRTEADPLQSVLKELVENAQDHHQIDQGVARALYRAMWKPPGEQFVPLMDAQCVECLARGGKGWHVNVGELQLCNPCYNDSLG